MLRALPVARLDRRILRVSLVLAALAAATLGQTYFEQKTHFWEAVALYLGGIGLTVLALGRGHLTEEQRWPRWAAPAVLLAVMTVALAIRLYQIGNVPYGVFFDESVNGLEGAQIAQKGIHPIWSEKLSGRPTLHLHILSLFFQILGTTPVVLRLVSALAGAATVLMLYLTVREAFDERLALLAAFFMAVMRWHINYSRIAFEAILAPLFTLLALYFLLRGLRSGRLWPFALAGLSVASGLYTYISFRMMPVVIALFLVYGLATHRPWRRWRLIAGVVLMAIAGLVAAWPLIQFALQYPGAFMTRFDQVSIFTSIKEQGSFAPLWENIGKHLLMFTFKGDQWVRHNIANAPALSAPFGVLFALGFGLAAWRIRQPPYFLMVVLFVVSLAAGVLTAVWDTPHNTRTITAIPAVALFAAIFVRDGWRLMVRPLGSRAVLALPLLALALAWVGYGEVEAYFQRQAQGPAVWAGFNGDDTAVGYAVVEAASHSRVLLSPQYYHFPSDSVIGFVAHGQQGLHRPFNAADELPVRNAEGDVTIILEMQATPVIPYLKQLYPSGVYREHKNPDGGAIFRSFWVSKDQIVANRGLNATYFANAEWSGNPTISRREATPTFGAEAPLDGTYSGEWLGGLYVPATTGYQFPLDEGMTISLDGGDVDAKGLLLAKGLHSIKVRYQGSGVPPALRWQPQGGAPEPIPSEYFFPGRASTQGLVATYFNNERFAGQPVAVQLDPGIFANNIILPNGMMLNDFSIIWQGLIDIAVAGRYAFATSSDDGSFVYIDGQLVVDNGGLHGNKTVEGSTELAAGQHELTVKYLNVGAGKLMNLYWTPPGKQQELVPNSVFHYRPGSFEIPAAEPAAPPAAPPVPSDLKATSDLPVRLAAKLGGKGNGDGRFERPRGIAVDQQGNLYVVDGGNFRVQKFDRAGRLVRKWGRKGQGDGEFSEPLAVAVDRAANVYVLDSGTGWVQRFNADGRFLGKVGGPEARFYHPRGLAVDQDGNVYVADTGGSRVVKLGPDGSKLLEFGGKGKALGQMLGAVGLLIGGEGSVYEADVENQRVQVFDVQGKYIRGWTLPPGPTVDGTQLAADTAGRVYLTLPAQGQVLVLDRAGSVLGYWGAKGFGDGQFMAAHGIAVDGDGSVYVSDVEQHIVQKFAVSW